MAITVQKPNKWPANEFFSNANFVYKAKGVLGHGGFGVVYLAYTEDGEKVAVKVQSVESASLEADVLRSTARCVHFCRLIDFGRKDATGFVVMELIGPSLTHICAELPEKQFTFSTAIRLSMQCLHAIEELHNCGFVSRDIKPGNFAIGLPGKAQRLIHMIDFGISCRIESDENQNAHEGDVVWRGTSRYCSLNNHRRKEQSKRDDIESWFYMSVEMLVGCLPWSRLSTTEKDSIATMKILSRTIYRNKFIGTLPNEFDAILDVIDDWNNQIKPDYDGLFVYLYEIMKVKSIALDDAYDWDNLPQYLNGRMMALK